MKNYNSHSTEQQEAGRIIFEKVKEWLDINLVEEPKIILGNDIFTHIEPDFYSEEHLVVGEIFSHIGKAKKTQDNKIAFDILKMLLLEKVTNKHYRKILVVCDETEYRHLNGKSVLAESIRQYGIEVKMIDIEAELRDKIVSAQQRQVMVNK